MNTHPDQSTPTPSLTMIDRPPEVTTRPVPTSAGLLDHPSALLPSPRVAMAAAPNPRAKTCTRNGKIARLPKLHRDMVNRMLRNNVPYPKIVAALEEFGFSVTQRNVSNWKTRGGYREWCLAQQHALSLRLHQDNISALIRKEHATDITEVGLQFAALRLSEFFLSPEASQLVASNPQEYHRRVADLARLNAEIHKLQKYRDDSARLAGFKHDPERNRRDTIKEIEEVRESFSSTLPADASGNNPAIPHRNFIPND